MFPRSDMRSVKGDCLLTLFQTWRSVSISLSCWRMQTTMLLHGGLKPQLRQDFDDGGTYSVLRWGVRVLEQIYSIMCTYIYIYRDNITTYNISYIYMNYNVCILYIYMVESSSHLGMLRYPFLHSFQTTFKLAGFDNEEWDFSAQHLRNCCRLEVPIIFC